MPFTRPTLSTLLERARGDIDARMPGADSRLRRSALDVLARTHAGATHGLYGYLDSIALNSLPDTATDTLGRWAAILGVTPKAATAATGTVTATGVNGSVIPTGTELQRADGIEYVTTAEAVIAGGVAVVSIEAVAAGTSGLALTGSKVSLISPIAGVAVEMTVTAPGLVGGADAESEDALRERVLDRLRRPPHGGNAQDYVRWAKEVPGVTRAWVYPLMNGLGTVGLTFVLGGREDLIPGAGDVTGMEAWIEARRPVTAAVDVFAPTPVALNLSITLLPDTAAIRASVEAELKDLLARDAVPGGTLLISRIREAISIAAGEADHVLTSPTANIDHDAGELAVLGTITWGA